MTELFGLSKTPLEAGQAHDAAMQAALPSNSPFTSHPQKRLLPAGVL